MPDTDKPIATKIAVKVNPDRLRKLPEHALRRPNYAATVPWVVVLPTGYTVEDALKPYFWSNVTALFKPPEGAVPPHIFITIVNEEHTLYALLYVRAIQETQMIVAQIGETIDWSIKDEVIHSLTTRWNVGKGGYDVVRAADKQVVQDGSQFKTKEQALDWIKNHLQAVAA